MKGLIKKAGFAGERQPGYLLPQVQWLMGIVVAGQQCLHINLLDVD